VTDQLAALREEVRKADRSLHAAVRRRLAIARRIGRAKLVNDLPLRDYAIEREVVRRWREGLAPAGVGADRAEELARWMVEESVRVQDALGPAPHRGASTTDALVVGGAGQMGGWLADFLSALGHRVAIMDPRASPPSHAGFPVRTDLRAAARDASLIAVATPMRVAPSVYRTLWDSGTKALVFDVLSIKSPILPWIRKGRAHGFHVGSIHPLFGPQVRSLTNRNLLIVDCGDAHANRRLRLLFERSSLKVTTVPLLLHDRWMTDALALPHATSLVFGLAMQKRLKVASPISDIAPTSFRRQTEAARVVSHESPELSLDIQTLNPDTALLFERMEGAIRALRDAVQSRDSVEYRRLMGIVAARVDDPANPLQSAGASSAKPTRYRRGEPAARLRKQPPRK
jgi:chorismate mutase/prephenate dehydrogenase